MKVFTALFLAVASTFVDVDIFLTIAIVNLHHYHNYFLILSKHLQLLTYVS
jgi:hypothetical protein